MALTVRAAIYAALALGVARALAPAPVAPKTLAVASRRAFGGALGVSGLALALPALAEEGAAPAAAAPPAEEAAAPAVVEFPKDWG